MFLMICTCSYSFFTCSDNWCLPFVYVLGFGCFPVIIYGVDCMCISFTTVAFDVTVDVIRDGTASRVKLAIKIGSILQYKL